MTTPSMIPCSTVRQRSDIRLQLEANRLPTEFVTDEHDATFAAAGLRPGYGTRIDSLLKGISHLAAARLLKALKEEVTA